MGLFSQPITLIYQIKLKKGSPYTCLAFWCLEFLTKKFTWLQWIQFFLKYFAYFQWEKQLNKKSAANKFFTIISTNVSCQQISNEYANQAEW